MATTRRIISNSKNYFKSYFTYTMYQYSDGRIRIIRNADKKMVYESFISEALDDQMVKLIWTQAAACVNEDKE